MHSSFLAVSLLALAAIGLAEPLPAVAARQQEQCPVHTTTSIQQCPAGTHCATAASSCTSTTTTHPACHVGPGPACTPGPTPTVTVVQNAVCCPQCKFVATATGSCTLPPE